MVQTRPTVGEVNQGSWAPGATEVTASITPVVGSTNYDLTRNTNTTIATRDPSFWDGRWVNALCRASFYVDLSALIAGDTVVIEILRLVSGSPQIISTVTYTGAQPEPVKVFEVVVSTAGTIQARIRQTAGVSRTITVRSTAEGGQRA